MEDPGQPQIDEQRSLYWRKLAEKNWLSSGKHVAKARKELIRKEIWDVLEEKQFEHSSLLVLEGLQLLESYLWPTYNEDVINHHVLLIALLVNVKGRQHLPTWTIFSNDPIRFSSLFTRILSMTLDCSLSSKIRTSLLCCLINAFQSLDNGLIRKECAPLVSISIWHNLDSDATREQKLRSHAQLGKAWRASAKRFEAADDLGKIKLRFERSWLYTLTVGFIGNIYEPQRGDIEYCERFVELLTDLESQLPTRRYVNSLLKDLNILALIRLSPLFNVPENGLFRDLYVLLRHFVHFPVDDHSGIQFSKEQSRDLHCQELAKLQRLSLKSHKEKLSLLALSNYGSIDQRGDLEGHLSQLNDRELVELCSSLGLRTTYPPEGKVEQSRKLVLEILVSTHEKQKTFQDSVRNMSVLPTEATLFEESLLQNDTYNGSRPLGMPKINLQYLTIGDFLWRSFVLHRCEQFFEIRNFLEETVKRLRPSRNRSDGGIRFDGSSRAALPVGKPAILEAAPPRVGQNKPAYVRAEITLDVSRLGDHVRKEWDSLRLEDTVFLVAVCPKDGDKSLTNGHAFAASRETPLSVVRVAEVRQVLDENGRLVKEHLRDQVNGHGPRPRIRRLIVDLDTASFYADVERKEKGGGDTYEQINLLVKRNRRENNFKKVLETVQRLVVSESPLPSWLQEVFLGFGDPTSATHTNLTNKLNRVDLRDTLLNWKHLVESFPEKDIETLAESEPGFGPPYILDNSSENPQAPKLSRKRRRDTAALDVELPRPSKALKVSSSPGPVKGPYPEDAPKINQIRFTPAQVEAVISGTQPGLTIIAGPPGTGKTDVATQTISNLYHNFPSQRTLLIAHSNQALNQLFQKITKLDIDQRHLLRLGQGEGDLETEADYSKTGRVESFLENRASYLAEVDRLAANFGAPGAHGASCETAGYFKSVYVDPAWHRFWDLIGSATSTEEAISCFPFHYYFQTAPQPLFPPNAPKDAVVDIARGCEQHVNRIFAELDDIRPFELLRNYKDKSNYLLVREARIIAMTATHAAMRRQEIATLGFHYDNIVMEEAAQVTEIENFIPLALQDVTTGDSPLQRVVLCGDHLQNSPVIQHLAFQQFSNLDQSLFLRMVRLGVPLISLDAQGRARPSIAELYRWRYPQLKNLQHVLKEPVYLRANAGFRYEYQFIDVPDYKGKGESHPSPHYIQNLGEAEYGVAIYQYMRLLGYPASKISILTTYAGQRVLIRDVLNHRCAGNRLFGMPRAVTTVDKYQGEQNDYIILSLVRTERPGYLRDLRRLTVALSRARLGLYILGRRSVFASSTEFTQAFALPFQRPGSLTLTTGEMYPTERLLNDEMGATEMVSTEHLGQYVYEMTQAKVNMFKGGKAILPPQESTELLDIDRVDDEVGGEDQNAIVDATDEPFDGSNESVP
ncbi:uncharacterized protein KY384_005450 [Bacidia gigantensis]|uniref:uncharacterized protein n=1 Tax=Bacidia gigantensis TaxID=2732470 RepID=UPI001D048B8F|nr:uncharacterized protein KY384_005450 [Bacidia gigantensis]KAG8529968.1 hypothetical protein KY384_005450 [Bacidia gigantensis]